PGGALESAECGPPNSPASVAVLTTSTMRPPAMLIAAVRLPVGRRHERLAAAVELALTRPRPLLQLPALLLLLGRLLRLPLHTAGAGHPEDDVLALVRDTLAGRADVPEAARAVELLRGAAGKQIPVRVPAHPAILARSRSVSRTAASSGETRTHPS